MILKQAWFGEKKQRGCANAAMHPLQAPSTPPASAARFDSGMKVWSSWVSCNSSGTVQDCRLIVAVVVRWPRGHHKMTIVQHHGITARLAQAWYMTLINLLPEGVQNALSLLLYLELPYLNVWYLSCVESARLDSKHLDRALWDCRKEIQAPWTCQMRQTCLMCLCVLLDLCLPLSLDSALCA